MLFQTHPVDYGRREVSASQISQNLDVILAAVGEADHEIVSVNMVMSGTHGMDRDTYSGPVGLNGGAGWGWGAGWGYSYTSGFVVISKGSERIDPPPGDLIAMNRQQFTARKPQGETASLIPCPTCGYASTVTGGGTFVCRCGEVVSV